MIYTVSYFNPLGNCENVTHVEADNEVDAALIAHADFWVTSKPFFLEDYSVSYYSPADIITKDKIYERHGRGGWNEETFLEKKKEALKVSVLEDWKYCYKKDGLKGLEDLTEDITDKYGSWATLLIKDILKKAGEWEDTKNES